MNPFDQVYAALWDMVSRHPHFSEVKEANRIRFDGASRDPIKENISTADLPEVTLVSEGLSAALMNTSSTSRCVRRYMWIIASGDFRMPILHKIEWALFVAHLGWRDVLTALEYPLSSGNNFVKRADFTSVTEGQSNREANRNIRGWSALWRCEVEMHFPTNSLREELT